MKLYIQGTGAVSPVQSYDAGLFEQDFSPKTVRRLVCEEPDYSSIIDVKLIRRMSKVIKIGVAAANFALKEAGIDMPDAILTGTAYGCLEDTTLFLNRLIGNQEEMLTPTAFIQSTHNTVGGQIALLMHNHGYNNTFVSRGFSFEMAMLDAHLLLQEGKADTVLVGGVDESTDVQFHLLERMGLFRRNPVSTAALISDPQKGTICGEGAAFFVMGKEKNAHSLAQVKAFSMIFQPESSEEVRNQIRSLISEQGLEVSDIDLLLIGKNGDRRSDPVYDDVLDPIFPGMAKGYFKHLSGEYPTASSFALWLAGNIFNKRKLPDCLLLEGKVNQPLRNILIYNHSNQIHHTLYLISAV